MKKYHCLCLLTSLILGLFTLSASKASKPLFRIPFEQVGSYIVLKASINQSEPIHLLLDTGIGPCLITELSAEDSVQLNTSSNTTLKGLGSGKDIDALVSKNNTLKIYKLSLNNQTIVVLGDDIFSLSRVTGFPINGILGSSLFENRLVQIDYDKKQLRFFDSASFNLPEGYCKLPLMLDGTKMYVDVTVTDASSSKRTLHMLVDTGAELAAWFRTQGDNPIPLPSKRFSSFIGKGLNGNILGEFGKMADIQLADFSLENVLVAFPDSVSIAHTLVQSDRNGTIGAQLLKRFNLIVDQQNQALYIKPNKNFNAPFLYNLAGMEVTKEAFSFSLPEIYYVREGSAAQKAGIREGDLIYEINGESGFKIELQELKHHLETPTEKIWMVLLRNGKIQKVSFPLKALL